MRRFHSFPVPPELKVVPKFATWTRRTYPTAVWRRDGHDLSVVYVALPKGTFFSYLDQTQPQLITSSAGYAKLAQAATMLYHPDVVLWISVVEVDAKFKYDWGQPSNGALLIGRNQSTISLKEWRSVRSILEFQPKRWNVATVKAIADFYESRRLYIEVFDGTAHSDGHTQLLKLCLPGLNSFLGCCSELHDNGDLDWNDYTANFFVRESERLRMRFVVQSLRPKRA